MNEVSIEEDEAAIDNDIQEDRSKVEGIVGRTNAVDERQMPKDSHTTQRNKDPIRWNIGRKKKQ
jgi:hypothetical protein